MRRLNAITEQLESLDFATTPGHVLNGLKREELVALNSTLLHELYFASLGGDGRGRRTRMREVLARDFGSYDRWRDEFIAMGYALGGGSGWVLLTYIPRDGRLMNQYAAEHTQAVAGGVPILALDMYEHAYHIDFGANAKAYVDTFLRNVDWQAVEGALRGRGQGSRRRGPLVQPEFGDIPGVGVEDVKAMLDAGKPVQVIDVRPRPLRLAPAGHRRRRHVARSGTPAGLDRRAVEVRAGGRVLRLRLPRRLQHRGASCARRASTRST